MDEKEISEIFGRLRTALDGEESPSEATKADMMRLAEGTLINLARVAALGCTARPARPFLRPR